MKKKLDRTKVESKVKRIIAQKLAIMEERIGMDSSLTNGSGAVSSDFLALDGSSADNLGADSLDLVEITIAIDEEFDIMIPDKDLDSFKSPRDIVDYIMKKPCG